MLWNVKNGQADVGNGTMSYVSFGRGARPFVILPGLSDGLATVKGKALMLAGPYRRFFDQYTVYMFSRRDDLPEEYSIREMAADQAIAMRRLGLEGAAVMGVSEGGMIAQYLAIDHPELVSRLVLAVTAPRAEEITKERLACWMKLAQEGGHKALMIDTAENSYSPAYLRKFRTSYAVIGFIGRPSDRYRRFLANARAILSFDASEELKKIACPVLIIGGADDKIVGIEASHELQRQIPGSELYGYEGLGHAAYEEAKDFNKRVLDFLEKTLPAAADQGEKA